MSALGRIDELRAAALCAAALRPDLSDAAVFTEADSYLAWLATPAVAVGALGQMGVADQDAPNRYRPLSRGADDMFVITDSQNILIPARTAADAKGFPAQGAVVLTSDDDADQAVAARTDKADGSTLFSANQPGTITLTWTCGSDSVSDIINVTAGEAVTFSDVTPVITDQ